MKRTVYLLGRALQLAGLLALPSAIVSAQMARNERASILIFAGSTAVFFAGYLLTRSGTQV